MDVLIRARAGRRLTPVMVLLGPQEICCSHERPGDANSPVLEWQAGGAID